MSNFVEIDVDFGYCGEVEMVLAHDEGGEHEDVEFYRDGLLAEDNAKLRELVRDMYKNMDVSCQFGHAIPAGTMAHIKNRVIGLGIEVKPWASR